MRIGVFELGGFFWLEIECLVCHSRVGGNLLRYSHMNQLQKLTEICYRFRKERDWEQFHNPKDQALSLVLEATEVLEHFQWKTGDQIKEYIKNGGREKLSKELADVMIYLLHMANDMNIDLEEAVIEKMKENEAKYPVEKAFGSSAKYTEL